MSAPAMKPDRRRTPRLNLEGLAYINFESDNGGIILNISEDGLCFHAVAPVPRLHSPTGAADSPSIPFWFTSDGSRIPCEGLLAWTDDTRKTGGLRFNALSPDARHQVRVWMSHSASPLASERRPPGSIRRSYPPDERVSSTAWLPSRPLRNVFSRWVRAPLHWNDFSRGLAAGLLIAIFVAAAFTLQVRRQQVGQFLIHLGQQFETSPQSATAPDPARSAAVSSPSPALQPLARLKPPAVPLSVSAQPAEKLPVPIAAKASPRHAAPPSNTHAPDLAPASAAPSPVAAVSSPALQPTAPLNQPATQPAPASPSAPAASAPTASASAPANSEAKILPAKSNEPANVNAEDVVEINSGMPLGKYFDVGKYKDQFAADQTKRNLADHGFRALVLPKSLLWMKSYQVLVGPYHNPQDAQLARDNLQSQGYKPHSLAKRSRQLTVVAPWSSPYSGSEEDVADFIVTWEAYSGEASVKYVKGSETASTEAGKWIKLPAKSDYTAIVYTTDDAGKRTLLSIQFRGMSQAVMLPNSTDHGIVF